MFRPALAFPTRVPSRHRTRSRTARVPAVERCEARALLVTGLPITNATTAYYNETLGNVLDGPTNTPNFMKPPDFSAGAPVLGDWLAEHGPPANGHWTGTRNVPPTWTAGTETALVYPINVAPGTTVQLTGSFGVDNGIFVWVDGVFRFGAIEEGSFFPGEYPNKDLGTVGPGDHFIQVLREDHGAITGYDVNITGQVLNGPRGTVQFSSDHYDVSEGQGPARILVTRTGGSFGAMRLRFKSSDLSAKAPADYAETFVSLTFADGEEGTKEVAVPIADDALPEANETVQLTLEDPLEQAVLGDPTFAVLTIHDDDGAGSVQFQTGRFEVTEGQTRAAIVVTRTGGASGALTARVASGGGSATAQADYTATTATVTFADGDTAPQTIFVPIRDDRTVEGDETVGFALTVLTGGATLGEPRAATLVIHDNDTPSPRFLKSEFRVRENGNRVRITLVLSGPSPTPLSFRVRTVQLARPARRGIATERVDYAPVQRTITFAPNSTSAQFFVSLLDDNITEGDERFGLEARDARTGRVLARSQVVIIDTARPRPR